jgi:pSer/pThr/pTyr-binding forkhead associated (FHA) protein
LAGKPSFRLTRALALVGSRRSAHLHLQSSDISNAHAIILNGEAKVYVRDLVSRSGVRINGRPVRDAYLEDGDQVAFGHFIFQFQAATGMRQRPVEDTTPAGWLEVDDAPFPLPIEGRVMVIGRRRGCDVVLAEETCSTSHAVIYSVSGKRFVRDLGSRTGTFLNGRWIKQEELHAGDVIRIGETDLRYATGRALALPPAPAAERAPVLPHAGPGENAPARPVPTPQHPRQHHLANARQDQADPAPAAELDSTPIVTRVAAEPPKKLTSWVVSDYQLLAQLASAAHIATEPSAPPLSSQPVASPAAPPAAVTCAPDAPTARTDTPAADPVEPVTLEFADVPPPVDAVLIVAAAPPVPREGHARAGTGYVTPGAFECATARSNGDENIKREPARRPRSSDDGGGEASRRGSRRAGGWFGLGKRRRVKSRSPESLASPAPAVDPPLDEELPLWDFADWGPAAAAEPTTLSEPAEAPAAAATGGLNGATAEAAMNSGDEFVRLDLDALPELGRNGGGSTSAEPPRRRARSRLS